MYGLNTEHKSYIICEKKVYTVPVFIFILVDYQSLEQM